MFQSIHGRLEFRCKTVLLLLQVLSQTCILSAYSVAQQNENPSCGCSSPKELQAQPRSERGQVVPHPFSPVQRQQEKHMA